MYQLLLIDDNKELQKANSDYLREKGYEVTLAYSGMEAMALLHTNTYDCILLDVMLPDLNGYAICEAARKTIRTPVIFLSCMDGEDDRIRGLMSGGDDYMVKPYSLSELGARVYAQIRRSRMQAGGEAGSFTNVMYDRQQRTVTINGTNLILTTKEFEILTLLLEHPGQVFSAGEIMEQVWGAGYEDESTVRGYIRRIRIKLGNGRLGMIDNDYGTGYWYRPYGESS